MKDKLGQIFTPLHIVEKILDEAGFVGKATLRKKIMEPSFGDGVFLEVILRRMITAARLEGIPNKKLEKMLKNSIYGIEIDPIVYAKTIIRLNAIMLEKGLTTALAWKLEATDALPYNKNFGKFDFVFGNPPYIRIHDLTEATRSYLKANYDFCKHGMIDIYLSFFELGLKFLKPTGKLAYITPNSYMKNASNEYFRKFLTENNLIEKIIDFKSNQVFDNVSTYTCITLLAKTRKESFFDYIYSNLEKNIFTAKINAATCGIKSWSFNDLENEVLIKKFSSRKNKLESFCNIQYGFATLRDNIFIAAQTKKLDRKYMLFNGEKVEKQSLKKIVKASTYKGKKNYSYVLFPYLKINNKLLPMAEAFIQKEYPFAYAYLLKNKEELLKRDMEAGAKEWFQFGRSQGLANMAKPKLIVSPLINGKIKVFLVKGNIYTYSGIFITAKNLASLKEVEKLLRSKDFRKYIALTSKEFRGGYININTKQIKNYTIDEIIA